MLNIVSSDLELGRLDDFVRICVSDILQNIKRILILSVFCFVLNRKVKRYVDVDVVTNIENLRKTSPLQCCNTVVAAWCHRAASARREVPKPFFY